MVKKLAAIILVLVGKHKTSDSVCWTWKEDLANQLDQLDYLHEISMSKIRNSDINKISNNRNTKKEITLHLSTENKTGMD
jgi:hypothetical protein